LLLVGALGVLRVLMSRVDAKLLLIALIGALRASSALAHEHAEQMPMGARLGSVSFQTSCQPQVQADFNRAVALLHSFWLDEAERTFMKVAIADPDCAMAYWGLAMADFNEVNSEHRVIGGGYPPNASGRPTRFSARRDTRLGAFLPR